MRLFKRETINFNTCKNYTIETLDWKFFVKENNMKICTDKNMTWVYWCKYGHKENKNTEKLQ